jgi:hypothetical protein
MFIAYGEILRIIVNIPCKKNHVGILPLKKGWAESNVTGVGIFPTPASFGFAPP